MPNMYKVKQLTKVLERLVAVQTTCGAGSTYELATAITEASRQIKLALLEPDEEEPMSF